MNIAKLYYFKKLFEVKHYTKAAKELYITQPTLSGAMASLEDDLGVKLFKKKGRSVIITSEAEIFYTYVCDALKILEEGIYAVGGVTFFEDTTLNIGCIGTFSGDFLPKMLYDYKKEISVVRDFTIHTGNTLSIIEGIHNKIYDIGICSKIHDPDIEFVPFHYENIVVVLKPTHPLASKELIELDDLKNIKMLTYSDSIPIGGVLKKLLAEHNKNVNYRYDDEITLCGQLLFSDFEAAIMADTPSIKQFDDLVKIRVNVPSTTRKIYVCYLKSRMPSNTIDSIVEFAVKKGGLNKDK